MTGRNLQEEAGLGKGVGGGCKTPKESSDKGPEVLFIPALESLYWDLTKQNKTKQNQPTNKKTVARREQLGKNPRAGECGR